MKKLFLLGLIAIYFFSCTNTNKQQAGDVTAVQDTVVLTVDQLYSSAADMVDKEVIVKGTVMHVCKEGGARCFLMGSNENINIRVEAGEKIGAFNQEQMGSELEIVGVLKVVRTEADAHNPGKEHGTEADEDSTSASAHKVIAESQEEAEVVYFLEGLQVKEL